MKNNRITQQRRKRAILQAKPVSMKEFLKRVADLAASRNEKYYYAECKILHSGFSLDPAYSYQFTCYINPRLIGSGKTPQEAFDALKKDMAIKEATTEEAIVPVDAIVDLPDLPF